MGIIVDEGDWPDPEEICDRCALDTLVDDLEIVEFTELEERWCSSCRDADVRY